MVFLIALTVAIKDIKTVTASGSPVAKIMRDQLGSVVEKSCWSRSPSRSSPPGW